MYTHSSYCRIFLVSPNRSSWITHITHNAETLSFAATAHTMAAYFFASPIDVDIKLEGEESRKQVEMKGEKDKVTSCPVYYDGDSVGGQVCILPFSDPS